MKNLILLGTLILWGFQGIGQTKKMTAFEPKQHGFKFDNTFKNIFIDALDWRTGGLCGGMVYSALDYYNTRGRSIPKTAYRPTEGSPLQQYLYDRQVTSLTSNLDKWGEIGFNPDGVRNSEFFNWGIENKTGSRINELRAYIDRGVPVPLGMQSVGEKDSDPGNHQVLAIGYDFGTPQDISNGNYKRKMRIYVYDPNFNGKTKTMVPNFKEETFYYLENPKKRWRTYFVDKNYSVKTPVRISLRDYPKDKKIHELVFEFAVGKDDLRGGNDNLNLSINYHGAATQRVYNINKGNKWIDNYSQYITIPLKSPVALNRIKSVQLNTVSGNDNFNLNALRINARGHLVNKQIYDKRGAPLKRFTGKDKSYKALINANPPILTRKPANHRTAGNASKRIPLSRKKIDKLRFWIRTGDDDLRGGNDNLNIVIHYKNGKQQVIKNVNKGTRWQDKSVNSVDITLNTNIVNISEISKVVLQTTFKGGTGGDNWNLNAIHIEACKGGKAVGDYYKKGTKHNVLHRFTDKKKTFVAKR
ncbi:hypothetical protein [Gelatiniphilus marinus]|uniref:Peptidase C39-like domain-containing protein n=1 Tax=Gelatiniphilus marinus TaxID=1759464 RepID=A0ABW5JUI4_9FLAO